MISAKRLALAGGILWAACIFITTILSIYTGFAEQFLLMMKGIYPGFSISWIGSVVGFVYGFIDAGIGCYLLAWIYNRLGSKVS